MSKKNIIISVIILVILIGIGGTVAYLISDKKNDETETGILSGVTVNGDEVTTDFGVIKLGDYSDLNVTESEAAVSDSDISAYISQILTAFNATEVNDDFINSSCLQNDINNQEELNEYAKDMTYGMNIFDVVWADVVTNSEVVSYDQDEVDVIVAAINKSISDYASTQGMSLDEYVAAVGMTDADLSMYCIQNAQGILKEKMVAYAIAKKENFDISDDVYNKVLLSAAFESGVTTVDALKELYPDNSEEDYDYTVLNYLLLDFFANNTTVVADPVEPEVDQVAGPQSGDTVAEITIKNFGVIKVRLFGDLAPKAVENFTTLSQADYYDGIIFHRVIDNFMIQGGDPTGTGSGGESSFGSAFEDEFSKQLIPVRGALCMANSGEDTNGSQFFIVQKSDYNDGEPEDLLSLGVSEALVNYFKENGGTEWLYQKHTVFGQVYEGMDVVDAIAGLEVDSNDKPVEDVVIEDILIKTYE